ncbi:MAG: hypothetical protein BroJett011_38910 [Chloroflexota bacterium]|nr:MAG: hypothetical protein BroJett011_38910 [Chloroflexota bacterium]
MMRPRLIFNFCPLKPSGICDKMEQAQKIPNQFHLKSDLLIGSMNPARFAAAGSVCFVMGRPLFTA